MTEFEKLQAIIADVLNVSPETITPDTTFVDDLGADSLDIFQIIMGIEEDFDIEIDNEEAEKITKPLRKNGVRNGKRHRSIQEMEKTEIRSRNITAWICSRIHQEMVFM